MQALISLVKLLRLAKWHSLHRLLKDQIKQFLQFVAYNRHPLFAVLVAVVSLGGFVLTPKLFLTHIQKGFHYSAEDMCVSCRYHGIGLR